MQAIKQFLKDENGSTAMEYALIASLLSVFIISAVTEIGSTLNGLFYTQIEDGLAR